MNTTEHNVKQERRCTIPGYELLTETQYKILTHWTKFGATGYPIIETGQGWIVDGHDGHGAYPLPFSSLEDAEAGWENYISALRGYAAGRRFNPALARAK